MAVGLRGECKHPWALDGQDRPRGGPACYHHGAEVIRTFHDGNLLIEGQDGYVILVAPGDIQQMDGLGLR